MEETNIPAQNVAETGQQEVKNPPVAPEPQPVTKDSKTDAELALELADDAMKELESAQKKIRHLERKKVDGGDPALIEEIEKLQQEVLELREQGAQKASEDSERIAKLKTRSAELQASLIAKITAGKASLGANQDKSRPEPPLPELNPDQVKLYSRIAARNHMTLDEWRKKNNK